jgi:hypothetical protein
VKRVTRRKVFDPAVVPAAFWWQADVRYALEHRDIGRLFREYLDEFPGCTQTQLALLTEHDRSEVSNWVRGVRQPRVSDIEVLSRIADGLAMPDEARLLLGLAPSGASEGWRVHRRITPAPTAGPDGIEAEREAPTGIPIAICGSRTADTDHAVVDSTVRALAKLVMLQGYDIHHGPVGVGIEVMTYIADHFHPPDFTVAVGRFGRPNVIRDAHYVVVVGGSSGTQDEVDLAIVMGKKVIPMPASGGTARRVYHQAANDPTLLAWMPDTAAASLADCKDGDDFAHIVHNLIATDTGVTSA